MVGAEELLDDSLTAQGSHSLDALPGDEVNGASAGNRLPDIDRAVQRARNQSDVLQLIAPVRDIRRNLVILAVMAERLLVEGLEDNVDLLLEELPVGVLVKQRRPKCLYLAGLVAATDAEDEPATGQHVAHGEVFGQPQRVPHGHNVEGCAELQVLGVSGEVHSQ